MILQSVVSAVAFNRFYNFFIDATFSLKIHDVVLMVNAISVSSFWFINVRTTDSSTKRFDGVPVLSSETNRVVRGGSRRNDRDCPGKKHATSVRPGWYSMSALCSPAEGFQSERRRVLFQDNWRGL